MSCDPGTGALTLAFHLSMPAVPAISYPPALCIVSDGQNMFASWLVPWKETSSSDVKHKNIEVC